MLVLVPVHAVRVIVRGRAVAHVLVVARCIAVVRVRALRLVLLLFLSL